MNRIRKCVRHLLSSLSCVLLSASSSPVQHQLHSLGSSGELGNLSPRTLSRQHFGLGDSEKDLKGGSQSSLFGMGGMSGMGSSHSLSIGGMGSSNSLLTGYDDDTAVCIQCVSIIISYMPYMMGSQFRCVFLTVVEVRGALRSLAKLVVWHEWHGLHERHELIMSTEHRGGRCSAELCAQRRRRRHRDVHHYFFVPYMMDSQFLCFAKVVWHERHGLHERHLLIMFARASGWVLYCRTLCSMLTPTTPRCQYILRTRWILDSFQPPL